MANFAGKALGEKFDTQAGPRATASQRHGYLATQFTNLGVTECFLLGYRIAQLDFKHQMKPSGARRIQGYLSGVGAMQLPAISINRQQALRKAPLGPQHACQGGRGKGLQGVEHTGLNAPGLCIFDYKIYIEVHGTAVSVLKS